MRMSIFILAIAIFCLMLNGCENGPQSGLPTVRMQIGKQLFTLEVANDDESRRIGLMNRESMPADHGMIFVFPDEQVRGFWMKDTHIPLEIVFLKSDGTVVSVSPMTPHDLRSVNSVGSARYAIEVNRGAATKAGVRIGEKLAIPKLPAPTSKPSK